MREIVNKLHENKQVELAKSILESNGYKVSKVKRVKESVGRETIQGRRYNLPIDIPPVVDFHLYVQSILSEEDLRQEMKSMDPILNQKGVGIEFSQEEGIILITGLTRDERHDLLQTLEDQLHEFGSDLDRQHGNPYREYRFIRQEDEE